MNPIAFPCGVAFTPREHVHPTLGRGVSYDGPKAWACPKCGAEARVAMGVAFVCNHLFFGCPDCGRFEHIDH